MKLTRLSGIDVYIHWSFWLLPAWIVLGSLGTAGLASTLATVGFVFAAFGCIVLHELGHALAARYYGIATRHITLYPIGGVAALERMPTRPYQELVIALAGPAVNVVIAGSLLLGLGIQPLLASMSLNLLGGGFLGGLILVNLGLVAFNMLPAFPMDGGRVLRAVLASFMPYHQATSIAASIGKGLAILLGIVGLYGPQLQLILIAAFVYLAASAEVARVSLSQPPRSTGWEQPVRDSWQPMHDENGRTVWVFTPGRP